MKRLAVVGAGDLGRQLVHHAAACRDVETVSFFDDVHRGETVAGRPVVGGVADLGDVVAAHRAGRFDALVMGIGYKHLEARARIFDDLRRQGIAFASLVHPSCYVDRGARIGEGAVLYPGCVLDAGVEIGANTLLNTGCVIAHDTRVGAHGFLGPAVRLAGFVEVGAYGFLGVGTVVVDNVKLGERCQTGGGTVVTESFEEGHALLVGVPARVARRTGPR